MSNKKPTTTGTKVSVFVILLFALWMIANRDNFSDERQANTGHAVANPPAAPPTTRQSNAVANQPVAPPTTKQSWWVQPRIYPGVKLYYSHDGTTMRYIGTIFDAVSRTIDGERCFGITMASGTREYKHREILWNGRWFMDRVQGKEARDEFNRR